MGICQPLLNQQHNIEWFLLWRFVDLLRIYFLLIISRNHSNRVKCYSKGYLYWYHLYWYNDMQINTGFPIVRGHGGAPPSIVPFSLKTRPPKPMPPMGHPTHLKMKPPIWNKHFCSEQAFHGIIGVHRPPPLKF